MPQAAIIICILLALIGLAMGVYLAFKREKAKKEFLESYERLMDLQARMSDEMEKLKEHPGEKALCALDDE